MKKTSTLAAVLALALAGTGGADAQAQQPAARPGTAVPNPAEPGSAALTPDETPVPGATTGRGGAGLSGGTGNADGPVGSQGQTK